MIETVAQDLLQGTPAIADFLFGGSGKKQMRRLYHLTSEIAEEDRLPVFRLGGRIYARKTTLLAWIARREQGG